MPNELREQVQTPDERRLLTLARQLPDIFIKGDPNHPWFVRHVAPDFKGMHDLSEGHMTASEYIDLIKNIRMAYGDRQYEIVDEQVDFARKKTATVWQSVRFVIAPETLIRNATRISKWRKLELGHGIEDEWICYECAVYRHDAAMSLLDG